MPTWLRPSFPRATSVKVSLRQSCYTQHAGSTHLARLIGKVRPSTHMDGLPRAELPYTSSGYYECVAHIEAFNNRLRSPRRTPVHICSPAYFALHVSVGDRVVTRILDGAI